MVTPHQRAIDEAFLFQLWASLSEYYPPDSQQLARECRPPESRRIRHSGAIRHQSASTTTDRVVPCWGYVCKLSDPRVTIDRDMVCNTPLHGCNLQCAFLSPLLSCAYCTTVLCSHCRGREARAVAAMASSDDAKKKLGESFRERNVMLVHPQSAVVHGLRHFYPYGEKPTCLTSIIGDATLSIVQKYR